MVCNAKELQISKKKQATGEKVSELKPAGKQKAPCFNVSAR